MAQLSSIQPKAKTGAEWLVHTLRQRGVETLFGYPGGAIMPVYDALPGSGLRHILTRHEQGAALAADAWGRVTGKAGVCLATSGPGATNLVTGIANAFLDSVPMVAITGQVATPLMGTDAFQEVDIFGMTMPVVKHSFIIREPEEIPKTVNLAFDLAESGRPGPVLIDLPKDITIARFDQPAALEPSPLLPPVAPKSQLERANQMIQQAEKPLFYVGGGVGISNACTELRDLVRRSGIPVVTTLKGLGAIPATDTLWLGMLGMHGNQAANLAVQNADLLIVVGARFDDRATGRLDLFAPDAQVIHLDVDIAEVSKLRHADLAVVGDLPANLKALSGCSGKISDWQRWCGEQKLRFEWRYDAPGTDVYAPALLRELTDMAGDDLIISCDVGQHQMWVAQHCRFNHPRAHLSSGGLGTMGYGLPAAIGAALARPENPVVCISGDGSIMMNIQELATLKRYAIPVKIILMDNASLGMVRQWQELFFDENYSEVDLSDNPDFVQVAHAFGLEAFAVRHRSEVTPGLERLLATPGPVLMHVLINKKTNVWPLVPPGKSNADMLEGKPL